jgi:hypothetical protein
MQQIHGQGGSFGRSGLHAVSVGEPNGSAIDEPRGLWRSGRLQQASAHCRVELSYGGSNQRSRRRDCPHDPSLDRGDP